MRAPEVKKVVATFEEDERIPFHSLMPHRVHNILLVASLYDAYTFEEDGRIGELLFAEYLELGLRYAPRVKRVSTVENATRLLCKEHFDLVISMPRIGEEGIPVLAETVCEHAPDVPLVVLAYNTRELQLLEDADIDGLRRVFVWQGDQRLFTAIIKSIEDERNADHDVRVAGVQVIILIEDSIRFYSSYLPMLYTELVKQTQLLMSETANRMQKLLRMRARPKLLLATTWEEGMELFERYKGHVLGVISDVNFPRDGRKDPGAGNAFARAVKDEVPDMPVLLQSTDASNAAQADEAGAWFLHKRSPRLLAGVREFMRGNMGFGDFVFRSPEGVEIARARNLKDLARLICQVPLDVFLHHAKRNHFSTWLMARTEFALARSIRPRKVEEFEDADAVRDYLVDRFLVRDNHARAGLVTEFMRGQDLETAHMFVRIGDGSLGGKGRGLAFMNSLFTRHGIDEHLPGVRITVPPTAILATGVFDAFMNDADLEALALREGDDQVIADAFKTAGFPEDAVRDLKAFLDEVRFPLAVRSSSLLEDASSQPFAGVYSTYMIPNNDASIEVRLEELLVAIKLVYASTFYADAKAYIDSTPNRLEEEKMAVVIQQVVGRRHGDLVYPNFAGNARSRNYYPAAGLSAEDGVACTALGLGNTVVDGGRCVRFSPLHPEKVVQFSSVEATLDSAQVEFSALDLSRGSAGQGADPGSNLVTVGLDVAMADGTLGPVGSIYSPDNDMIYDGVNRAGVPLVTLSGVLKAGIFPLGEVLDFLLNMGSAAFACPVEMEYAVSLRESPDEPHEFGFLQIRPLGGGASAKPLDLDGVDDDAVICTSRRALGHGLLEDLCDLVYVRRDTFDRGQTEEIAREVGRINATLKAAGRRYILVGPGRWGTADRWLGIPVSWSQVSQVGCFVETDLDDISVEPSQGTHFFQNITSLGIGYFTLNFAGEAPGRLDMDWLDAIGAETETPHLRHLVFDAPLEVMVDSRSGAGVVMKPTGSPKSR